MPYTKRVVVVAADLLTSRDYLADFSTAVQWDPGTVSCVQRGEGPVEPGTHWDNVTRFLGRDSEIDYRLEYRGPERVLLIGENKTVTSIDDIALRTVDGGTEITYLSDVTFHGAAKLIDPLVIPVFNKLGDRTAANLKRLLAG